MKWWIACLLGGTAGCSESEYCDGNVAHTLSENDHGQYWSDIDCGSAYCVESTYHPGDGVAALCAPEPEPRAICIEDSERMSEYIACMGAERVTCRSGYALQTRDCGAPELCEPSTQNCLARAGVDATCAAQIDATGSSDGYCEGRNAIGCDGVFVTRVNDCGQIDLCHVGPSSHAQCVLATTPDPRCPAPDGTPYTTTHCEGTLRLSCFDGYLAGVDDCTDPANAVACSSCN